jgi:ABC-2 type transport system permease protein
MAFYAPVAAEEISSYVIDSTSYISSFPLSGMPNYLQISLTTLIPAGLMAWFPSLILLGKPPLNIPVYYPLVFAIILSVIATILFKKGLNYYVKKGSNRYSTAGHRR